MQPPPHQLLGAHAISSQRSRGGTDGMILPALAVRTEHESGATSSEPREKLQ